MCPSSNASLPSRLASPIGRRLHSIDGHSLYPPWVEDERRLLQVLGGVDREARFEEQTAPERDSAHRASSDGSRYCGL